LKGSVDDTSNYLQIVLEASADGYDVDVINSDLAYCRLIILVKASDYMLEVDGDGLFECIFFFSSRRRHTRFSRDWSSDVCSSDLTYRDIINKQLPNIVVNIGCYLPFKPVAYRDLCRDKDN